MKLISVLLLSLLIMTQNVKGQVELNAGADSAKHFRRSTYLSDNLKTSEMDLLVDSMVKSFMQSPENCGISIGISQQGKTFFYNYGELRKNSKLATDQKTIYETGSLSATFCGMLLSYALVEKKISLDDDIRKYLPGKFTTLSFGKIPIRIRHLATHTSGLPQVPQDLTTQSDYDSKDPYKNYSREKIFMHLQHVKLNSEPGKVCDYSSFGIALLGIILEKIYATPFENLVKEKICSPLGMTNTAIHLTAQQETHFADGYTEDGDSTTHWNLNDFAAAGGFRSSAQDLLTYLDYLVTEKDEVSKLVQQAIYKGERETLGLTWFIKKTKQGNTLAYQSGGTFGSGGFSGFIKEKKSSVIILANSGRNIDYIAIALLNYLQQ